MALGRLPLGAAAIGLMALLAVSGVAVGVFVLLARPGIVEATRQISQDRRQILSQTINLSQASFEKAVISVAPNVTSEVVAQGVQAFVEETEAEFEELASKSQSVEEKYEQLRETMGARGLPLRRISDYQEKKQINQYPKLTYDSSMASYFYEFGAYLAGECTSCHKVSYDFTGIPLIFGLDESYFVGRLNDYKNGQLTNKAMTSVARNLDDEMMVALALFFKTQEPKGG